MLARIISRVDLPGDGAYRQLYTYDVFNNLSGRDDHFWGHAQPVDSTTYTNERRAGWIHDNPGNVTGENGQIHSYDVASRDIRVTGGGTIGVPAVPVWEIAQTPNGDGQPTKRIETRRTLSGSTVVTTTTTTYYVRSSVLGGEKLVELDAAGNKLRSYVYGAGTRLAKHELIQGSWQVRWYVGRPVTNDWGETISNGNFVDSTFLDPLGAEIPPNDPYLLDPTPTYVEQKGNDPLFEDGGDPFNLSGGCTLDGVPVSCNFVRPLENSDVAVHVPNGETTRFRNGRYEFFQAFADGRQGYLPLNGQFGPLEGPPRFFNLPILDLVGQQRQQSATPTPQPCSVQSPTDRGELAAYQALLGESEKVQTALTPAQLSREPDGGGKYAPYQQGTSAYGKAALGLVSADDVFVGMTLMVWAIQNRLENDGRWKGATGKSWYDVVNAQSGGQYEIQGYPGGQIAAQNLGNEGDEACIRAAIAIAAISFAKNNLANKTPYQNWRGIKQGNWIRPINGTKLSPSPGAVRFANTDFF